MDARERAVELKPVDKMDHMERAEYFLGSDHPRFEGCVSHFKDIERAAREDERRKLQDWKCKAKPFGDGSGEPQDCAWPGCGCDPHADRVIEALEESGAFDLQAAREQALEEAASAAERTPLRSPVAKQRDKIAASIRALKDK